MSSARARRGYHTDPFTDLLFNALLGFTFLFLVAIMFMNPIAKEGIINLKAEYIISIAWPDGSPDDVDVWVESPRGDVLWFRNPEAGLLHLDRDDRGALNDSLEIDGETVTNPLNQEIVTMRGIVAGEYVVNVHYYASETEQPVDVTVKVEKVNPFLEVVYYKTLTLAQKGEEKTAVRFKVRANGEVWGTNSLPKQIVTIK
ncbi:MAG: hypothetical protein ISR48_04965 [Alphaproteobacteria bacterium]|nr:hypothetical protein [Alphaproteobacteria bacterium]